MKTRSRYLPPFLVGFLLVCSAAPLSADEQRPNILFILTDDQRWDGFGSSGNERIHTPHLDRIAERGVHFRNAFVTLAICSPSRAACLTGRYGSSNGVTTFGAVNIKTGEPTFARALRDAGYRTGLTGKWHLKTTPEECGFDFVAACWGNGTWYNRRFTIDGEASKRPGFVDDVTADESIRFIRESQEGKKPFVLWMCTQVPHMDNHHEWPAEKQYLDNYDIDEMPLPKTWNDDLSGKPEYLKTARNRTQALKYGYDKPEAIRKHARDYYAGVQQMDAALGRVLDELDRLDLRGKTWIIYMGDNGWMLGEHGMTSKVLPYEESMRVPMVIAGPDTKRLTASDLVLNIDLTATIYELAGIPIPDTLHGRSLLQLVDGKSPKDWRTSFLYEAPTSQLGSQPLWAVRTQRWKYIETQTSEDPDDRFAELYDMQADAVEIKNLAREPEQQETVERLAAQLRRHQKDIASQDARASTRTAYDKLEGIQARRSNNKDVAIPPSEN
jgi:arylsulfatase A-like enzyme